MSSPPGTSGKKTGRYLSRATPFIAAMLLLSSVALLAVGLRGEVNGPAGRDFIAYWSAGRLLASGANPYSPSEVLALERTAGYLGSVPLIMRNPPWTLFVTLPLGWLNAYWGALFWTLFVVSCIMIAVRVTWFLNGRPSSRTHLLAYMFAPTIACVITGQASVVALLGVVLFLFFLEVSPWAAGLGCFLMAIKPHLFLLFWPVLLAYCIREQRTKLLLGFGAAFIVASSSAVLCDHDVFRHYWSMSRASLLPNEFIPVPATLFRAVLGANHFWLQFLPALFGLLWAGVYYGKNRRHWNWRAHGSLLLVFSVFVAPYGWFTDEIVLIPVLLTAVYRSEELSGRLFNIRVIGLASLNSIALVMILAQIPIASGLYIWTSLAWLTWYVSGNHRPHVQLKRSSQGG